MKSTTKTLLLVMVLALVLAFAAGCQPTTPTEHVHTLVHMDAKAPTCVNNGINEHWYCPECNARFSDAGATTEVTFADLEIEENGHTAGEDDGDCTTAVDCTVCGKVATAAKPHTPAEDDGNCLTAVACTECEKNAIEANDAHEAAEDDGDCTTAVKCAHCDVIVTEAKEAHEAAEDDGDCTTAVKCAHCDVIVTEGLEAHDYVDGYCSECSSIDPSYYFPATITEALAKADGANVKVSGTVSAINTAWSDSYGNISVTITDDSGNTLYLYRLATNVALGDIITVEGTMATYSGNRQIAAGATAEITGHDTSYDYKEMSIVDAIAAADNTNVIVTGTVVKIGTAYSSSYNNISVYIADEEGNQLYLYRLTGNVTVGQIIKVKGTMATYSGARQVAGGTFEDTGLTHTCTTYTDATCTKLSACVVCGATTGELADHTYVDGTCSVCGAQEGVSYTTVSTTMADYAAANSWSNGTLYSSVVLDSNITVTATGSDTNTGKYYTSGTNWRMYQAGSPSITVTAAEGKTIASVKITYVVNNTGVLTLNGEAVDTDTVVAVDASSVTFSVGNSGTATNGQVRITAIEVVYY